LAGVESASTIMAGIIQQSSVQDVVDAVNGLYLGLRQSSLVVNQEFVEKHATEISELERLQDQCEENLERVKGFVESWRKDLEKVRCA
jgi:hypothetical protein